MKIFKFLFPYIAQYKGRLLLALASLLAAAAITLTLPIIAAQMLDNGLENITTQTINTQNKIYLLFLLAILLAIASAARYYFVIWIGEKIVADIRNNIFTHITKMPATFFDKNKSGEIISHINNDTVLIKSVAGATTSMALRNTILLVGATLAMIYTNIFLSIITLAALPIIILPIMALGKLVRKKTKTAQDQLSKTSSFALAAIEGMKIIQTFKQEKQINKKFKTNIQKTFAATQKSFSLRALLTFIAIFITFNAIILIMWLGSKQVLENTISAGTLAQFIIYAIIAAGSIAALAEVWGELSQAAGATQRIAQTLQQKNNIITKLPHTKIDKQPNGKITFKNICFKYHKQNILKNLNLTIKPKSHVAIVGATGAGKTTIFNLLLRHYNITSGEIFIDEHNIEHIKPKELRKYISIVPQENIIFADTIYENIRFAKPQAKQSEIYKAGKLALINEFANKLPKKYHTQIGERGANLSTGQKQRIMLARAFLRNSPIILFDEATSALDAKSEALIYTAMKKLMKNKTTITIAHRFSTITNADKIFVLKNGKISEHGKHKNLIKNNGLYAKLAKLQQK